MKIAVFGCSWTYGVPIEWSQKITSSKYQHNIPNNDFVNWTRELGKLDSSLEIYNYAVPGTNIEFSLGMLERYLKNPYCDITVFQATRPYRYTYWEQNFDEKLHFKKFEENVYQFSESLLNHVTIVDHHEDNNSILDLIKHTDSDSKYVKNYFKNTSYEMFENTYRAVLEYVNRNTDICFAHESNQYITNIEDILGNDTFNNYCCDIGKHFGHTGAKWQAKWLLDKINTYRG